MKYKLIKEYDKFYLCEYELNNNKFRTCFLKVDSVVKDGYVYRRRNNEIIWCKRWSSNY